MSCGFLDWAVSSWVSTLQNFGGYGLCEYADITFLTCHLTTWLMCYVTLWLEFAHPHNPAKFGGCRLCESGDKTLFICHVTTISNLKWLCGRAPLIQSDHLATFGLHKSYGNGDNAVCNISSSFNSNSISNAEAPILRFIYGPLIL